MARSRRSSGGVFGVDEQRLLQHVADLLARVERAIRVLEHDLDLAAHLRRQAIPGEIDLVAVDQQIARRRRIDQRDDARKRGLAAAALADDCQRLAFLDAEGDALHRMHGLGLGKHAARQMVIANDIAAFKNGAHSAPSSGGVFKAAAGSGVSTKSSVMVGRRSPVALSGSAASSALV